MIKSRLMGAMFTYLLLLSGFASNATAASFMSISSAYTGPMGTSSGWAISGDGSTVVGNLNVATEVPVPGLPGQTYTQYTQTAFSWSIGATVGLLPFSNATDVSYDGSVIVGERYRWTQATGAQDIGQLGSGGATAAYGVSSDGSTVVGFSDGPNGREAYRWTQTGGMEGLGFLPATNNLSRANAVSADGNTVVGGGYGGAFQWTPSTGMTNLETIGPLNDPFYGQPNAISADGTTVGGQSPEAWLWTEAGGLNFLGFNQAIYGLSADGSVAVGGDQWSPSSGTAFIWDSTNGTRPLQAYLQNTLNLDLSGWTLYAALGVSDDGTKIVGVGTNPLGIQEAWYADISSVPVPPAIWLFGTGLLGLIGIARKKTV